MSDEITKHLNGCVLNRDDGTSRRARFYVGDGEDAPAARTRLDSTNYMTWEESDGTIGICRTSSSVGASRTYSAKYDDIDWGN